MASLIRREMSEWIFFGESAKFEQGRYQAKHSGAHLRWATPAAKCELLEEG